MLRWLLVVLLMLILINGFSPLMQKMGLGRLPGDLRFKVRGREWFFPITTTLLLSFVFALVAKFV